MTPLPRQLGASRQPPAHTLMGATTTASASPRNSTLLIAIFNGPAADRHEMANVGAHDLTENEAPLLTDLQAEMPGHDRGTDTPPRWTTWEMRDSPERGARERMGATRALRWSSLKLSLKSACWNVHTFAFSLDVFLFVSRCFPHPLSPPKNLSKSDMDKEINLTKKKKSCSLFGETRVFLSFLFFLFLSLLFAAHHQTPTTTPYVPSNQSSTFLEPFSLLFPFFSISFSDYLYYYFFVLGLAPRLPPVTIIVGPSPSFATLVVVDHAE